MLYPASLILLALLIFTFFRNNNNILAILALLLGIYIVYSHETGYTATNFRDEMVDSLDKSAQEYKEKQGATGYDMKKNTVK